MHEPSGSQSALGWSFNLHDLRVSESSALKSRRVALGRTTDSLACLSCTGVRVQTDVSQSSSAGGRRLSRRAVIWGGRRVRLAFRDQQPVTAARLGRDRKRLLFRRKTGRTRCQSAFGGACSSLRVTVVRCILLTYEFFVTRELERSLNRATRTTFEESPVCSHAQRPQYLLVQVVRPLPEPTVDEREQLDLGQAAVP
jgi:hypothetical protein